MKKTIKYSFMALGVAVVLCMSSCGVYAPYQTQLPEQEQNVPHWREVFTDPKLQVLIDSALSKNHDVATARLNIEKAEIAYKASRLNYLPTASFSPWGQGLGMRGSNPSWSYSLGMTASWQIDILNGISTNDKRGKKAMLAVQKDYEQAVECLIISSMAQSYFHVLQDKKQLKIMKEMVVLYEKTLDATKTLFEVGQYTSPAVEMARAQVEDIKLAVLDLEDDVCNTEQLICLLMNETPHAIETSDLDDIRIPTFMTGEISAEKLGNRPDVRAAEREMEIAYYNVLLKKGQMLPSINITGDGGWMNPTTWFIDGIGSLTQPIFQGGKLRADLKIAKADQKQALMNFRNTVINAAHEVDNAMGDCKLAKDKQPLLRSQVIAMENAVNATQELMNNGSANYLEVLLTMRDLLNAKNNEVQNQAFAINSMVCLYSSLGGR